MPIITFENKTSESAEPKWPKNGDQPDGADEPVQKPKAATDEQNGQLPRRFNGLDCLLWQFTTQFNESTWITACQSKRCYLYGTQSGCGPRS